MNKKVLKVAFVAAIALVSGINVFNSQKTENLSDVVLANVEALAMDEAYTETTWSCVGLSGKCGAECGLCGTKISKSKGTLTGYHKCSL